MAATHCLSIIEADGFVTTSRKKSSRSLAIPITARPGLDSHRPKGSPSFRAAFEALSSPWELSDRRVDGCAGSAETSVAYDKVLRVLRARHMPVGHAWPGVAHER
jgi:hypothetical protein